MYKESIADFIITFWIIFSMIGIVFIIVSLIEILLKIYHTFVELHNNHNKNCTHVKKYNNNIIYDAQEFIDYALMYDKVYDTYDDTIKTIRSIKVIDGNTLIISFINLPTQEFDSGRYEKIYN